MKNFKAVGIALVAAVAALLSSGADAPTRSRNTAVPGSPGGVRDSGGIICLMYHRFVTSADYAGLAGDERVYSIPVERFEEQLAELRRWGYRAIGADEAVAFARGEGRPPHPAVLITIDDGNRSALTMAEPLLRKYGMRATLFVTTDPCAFVFDAERPDRARLTDDEIRSLDPRVLDVQAHGATHRPLRDLSDRELAAELRESREVLSNLTGRRVAYMAVPGNWYDERVLTFARREGYDAVFVSDRGRIVPGTNPYRMPRYTVQGYKSLGGFRKLIAPGAAGVEPTR
ncbi:MAG: hypothetical protein DCC65_11850 [Planctomycetota bacterium]|nr:MAG: hypothetical protein DCC65_11850 [Planctomycetota bacterium]